MKSRKELRYKRKNRYRSKVLGTSKRPRLSVFRSNTSLYAQIINDDESQTLVGSSVRGNTIDHAQKLVVEIVSVLKKKGIRSVVFDRGGHLYHGVIKVFADTVRKGGVQI